MQPMYAMCLVSKGYSDTQFAIQQIELKDSLNRKCYGMIRLLCVQLFTILCVFGKTQDSIVKKKFMVSGFLELYYQYDLDKPASNERPPFIYNHKRHNTVAVNLALLQFAYKGKKIKANLGLMAGDYSTYNLAAEPGLLKHIYEASVGYQLSEKMSVDAGVFPSHIGSETAISKDCWNLSRSLVADNSPYYETGVKLNYAPNQKWTTSFLLLNGWQNIKETNTGKAIGTQVQFKPNAKWLFNSSSFIGNEQPDSIARAIRLFHNFFVNHSVSPKLNTSFLFDIGTERKHVWWGTAIMLQYVVHETFNTAFRAEYYKDRQGVIVQGYLPTGFEVAGISCNFDYIPAKFIRLRTEAKYLHAADAIFIKNGVAKSNNFSWLLSAALSF